MVPNDDTLGSATARTDRTGAVSAGLRYQPWGEEWSYEGEPGDRQFNGRVYDSGTGFHNYAALPELLAAGAAASPALPTEIQEAEAAAPEVEAAAGEEAAAAESAGQKLSAEAQRGIRSLEQRIAEHEQKLADFKANPRDSRFGGYSHHRLRPRVCFPGRERRVAQSITR